MRAICLAILFIFICISCSNDDNAQDNTIIPSELYFPPLSDNSWETVSVESLNWNTDNIPELLNYLEANNTRAFMLLKDGRIVIEEYWGNNLLGTAPFDQNTNWYWASAGKTITATLTGIAQQEGFLDINDKTSDYLGNGWTSLPAEKENLISIKNQLSMTTGLDYDISDLDCTLPSCLTYKADAGTQWYYHNAPYTLLGEVISQATQMDYNQYTNEKLESKIGMDGQWIPNNFNNVYWSTPRDMARFGLLMLNKGIWDETPVLADENYYNDMVNSSQELNPSYGYLWWLNGKDSVIFPGIDIPFNISLSDNAPIDLVAGMGKNGQFVELVPEENIVIIRMGEAPDNSLVPIEFHNEVWAKISEIIDN
jgi:CubicO group peptidase (beta-lactamase class C family)